jgi:hypothetical protein
MIFNVQPNPTVREETEKSPRPNKDTKITHLPIPEIKENTQIKQIVVPICGNN